MPAAGVDALRHTRPYADGVVLERTFPGIGRCVCVLLKRPQDHEGIEVGCAFIFWKDDPVITEQLRPVATEARMLPFSETPEEGSSSYIDAENELIFNTPVQSMKMPRADLALNGLHNVFNSMAAGLSACLCDVSKEDIREALSDFEGVEHRLEFTADIDGVRWINEIGRAHV